MEATWASTASHTMKDYHGVGGLASQFDRLNQ